MPCLINSGWPPTPLNALTGELTPPGMCFWAASNSLAEIGVELEGIGHSKLEN